MILLLSLHFNHCPELPKLSGPATFAFSKLFSPLHTTPHVPSLGAYEGSAIRRESAAKAPLSDEAERRWAGTEKTLI